MFLNNFVPKLRLFPTPAKGWENGVYYERQAEYKEITWEAAFSEKLDENNTVAAQEGSLVKLTSLMWTETESTGFGIYPFIEGVVITHKSGLKNGKYTITFQNPSSETICVSAYANDVLKLDNFEVAPGSTSVASFELYSIEEETTIQFFVPDKAVAKEEAKPLSLYISDLVYEVIPNNPKKTKPTIYLASDSTVQSYEEFYYPQTGWGQVFARFFGKGNVDTQCNDKCYPQCHDYELPEIIVENRSIGARSARSFINEGKWDALLKRAGEGDICLIQWAHNDATAIRPNRYVAPKDFAYYLKKYVYSCRARGIDIVFVTPVSRRNCDEHDGQFVLSFEKYRDVMLELGKEEKVPVIDLCKESCDYLTKVGPDESKLLYLQASAGQYPDGAYADGVHDNVHLQEYGAMIYAKIVADGLSKVEGHPSINTFKKYIDTSIEIKKPEIKVSEKPIDPEVPSAFALQELHVENKMANFLLTWGDVEGAVKYNVYRKGSVDFQFFPLRTVSAEEKKSAAVMPFTLPAADVYQVKVTAVFADGNESKPSRTIEFRA